MKPLLSCLFSLCLITTLPAAEFDITKYGATPNDQTDDTLAINKALAACGEAGGGTLLIPKGTFLVSRQKSESPILEIPSDTIVQGTGDESILKFTTAVNKTNFWRMLGASKNAANITIQNLHLDGSNTHQSYVKGKTFEQNHGVFFYNKGGKIENVTVKNCLVENFSGDCISFSQGCRKFTIKNIRLRNFIRQGIQMGGGKGDGDYFVTGCRDLKHTVKPGGSTIHVEHAEGAKGIRIIKNICNHHLIAGGGATDLVVQENTVVGRVEGNSITNGLFENNEIDARGVTRSAMQFGYANKLTIRGNTIKQADQAPLGIYIWGKSRYNPNPSREVLIEKNSLEIKAQPILLNGVEGATIRDNTIKGSSAAEPIQLKRTMDVKIAQQVSK